MRMKRIVNITSLLLLGAIYGCLEEASFPDEPFILFESLTPASNQTDALLVLGFTDGDGDFGLSEADLDDMIAIDPLYANNVFIEYFEREGDEWVAYPTEVPYYYRIPRITPSGQNPALKGEIRIDVLAYFNPFTENDSFRYEIFVVDRALNESNLLVTPSFSKP